MFPLAPIALALSLVGILLGVLTFFLWLAWLAVVGPARRAQPASAARRALRDYVRFWGQRETPAFGTATRQSAAVVECRAGAALFRATNYVEIIAAAAD